jgi:hypothetical protein
MSETDEAEQWAGIHVTPGRKDDQSAFRSEIGGVYAMAVAIELLCKFFHTSNGSVSFGSDCEAALYYIFDRNKKSTATTNSFYLIMATRKVVDRLPISFSHRHVPTHQDISREEMDIWGRANDDCDTDAKAFWKKGEAAGTLVTLTDLCDEPWSLWIQGEKLSSNVKRNIYNSIHDPEATKTWGLRDLQDNEDINVPARRQTAKSSNIPLRLWVMKHRHGMTGTGKFMKLWGYRSTQQCPRCGHHCETADQVTMCKAPSVIEQWKISLETLGKDLAKRHTHPGMTRFLLSRLLEWKTRTPRKALRMMEHDLQELQDAQYDIGWDKFMFGNISELWQEIQAQYF